MHESSAALCMTFDGLKHQFAPRQPLPGGPASRCHPLILTNIVECPFISGIDILPVPSLPHHTMQRWVSYIRRVPNAQEGLSDMLATPRSSSDHMELQFALLLVTRSSFHQPTELGQEGTNVSLLFNDRRQVACD